MGVCVDAKHGKFYWTQKGSSKAGKGRIFRANIAMPSGESASSRSDVETLFERLPEPIDLDIDPDEELLYWTDRGEYPLGNSLNRASVGKNSKVNGNAAPKFDVLTRHLHEVCVCIRLLQKRAVIANGAPYVPGNRTSNR